METSLLKYTAAPTAMASPTKFAPVDWHTSNLLQSSTAERQRQISHDIRQLSNATRNVTGEESREVVYWLAPLIWLSDSNTEWTQHGTNSQLAYRIEDIDDWKKTLTITLQNVEAEIAKV